MKLSEENKNIYAGTILPPFTNSIYTKVVSPTQ